MGYLLHGLAGGFLVLLSTSPLGLQVLVLALFGLGREVWQHDLVLTRHQLMEGLAWPLGALVAGVLIRLL